MCHIKDILDPLWCFIWVSNLWYLGRIGVDWSRAASRGWAESRPEAVSLRGLGTTRLNSSGVGTTRLTSSVASPFLLYCVKSRNASDEMALRRAKGLSPRFPQRHGKKLTSTRVASNQSAEPTTIGI